MFSGLNNLLGMLKTAFVTTDFNIPDERENDGSNDAYDISGMPVSGDSLPHTPPTRAEILSALPSHTSGSDISISSANNVLGGALIGIANGGVALSEAVAASGRLLGSAVHGVLITSTATALVAYKTIIYVDKGTRAAFGHAPEVMRMAGEVAPVIAEQFSSLAFQGGCQFVNVAFNGASENLIHWAEDRTMAWLKNGGTALIQQKVKAGREGLKKFLGPVEPMVGGAHTVDQSIMHVSTLIANGLQAHAHSLMSQTEADEKRSSGQMVAFDPENTSDMPSKMSADMPLESSRLERVLAQSKQNITVAAFQTLAAGIAPFPNALAPDEAGAKQHISAAQHSLATLGSQAVGAALATTVAKAEVVLPKAMEALSVAVVARAYGVAPLEVAHNSEAHRAHMAFAQAERKLLGRVLYFSADKLAKYHHRPPAIRAAHPAASASVSLSSAPGFNPASLTQQVEHHVRDLGQRMMRPIQGAEGASESDSKRSGNSLPGDSSPASSASTTFTEMVAAARSVGANLLQVGMVKAMASPAQILAYEEQLKQSIQAQDTRLHALAAQVGDAQFHALFTTFLASQLAAMSRLIPSGPKLSNLLDPILKSNVDAYVHMDRKVLSEQLLSLKDQHLHAILQANLLKAFANLAQDALDGQNGGPGAPLVLTAVVSQLTKIADKYIARLSADIASVSEPAKRARMQQQAFEAMVNEILGQAFPRGESDLEVSHHLIPQAILLKLIWEVLKQGLSSSFKQLFDPLDANAVNLAKSAFPNHLVAPLYSPKRNVARICDVASKFAARAAKEKLAQGTFIKEVVESNLPNLLSDLPQELGGPLAAHAAQVAEQLAGQDGLAVHKGIEKFVENALYPHITQLIKAVHQKEQAHLKVEGDNALGQPQESFDVALINGLLTPIVKHLNVINQARGKERDDLNEGNYRRAAKAANFLHEGIFYGDSAMREKGKLEMYRPIGAAVLKGLGLQSKDDLTTLPPAMREAAWSKLQLFLPNIVGGILESAVDHNSILNMLVVGLQNFNEALAPRPNGAAAPSAASPLSKESAEIDAQCGALLNEVVKMVPMPLGLDKFVSSETVGKAFAASMGGALRKQLDGEFLMGALEKGLRNEFDLTRKTDAQKIQARAAQEKLLRDQLHRTVELIVPKLWPSLTEAADKKLDAWTAEKMGKPGQVIKKVIGWFLGAIFAIINALTLNLLKKGMTHAFEMIVRSYLHKYANRSLESLEVIAKGPLPCNWRLVPNQTHSDVHLNALLHALQAGAEVWVKREEQEVAREGQRGSREVRRS